MANSKNKKILLIMPPFWDPICPPQGILCLQAYLENKGYEVTLADFNMEENLFGLQKKYFELGMHYFPQWQYLNIFRNGPRYFSRHQLALLFAAKQRTKYEDLISLILNFDGKSLCTKEIIQALDSIIKELFNIIEIKTRELMDQLNPDAVGCAMLESTLPASLAILRKVKEINKETLTILGGPGVIMGNTLADGNLQRVTEKCEWIDVIIHGEGERLLESYLEHSFKDKKIITINDLQGDPSLKAKKSPLIDINDLPIPSYQGLPAKRYMWLSTHTSRGCPYNCAFCTEKTFWVSFRKKHIKKIVDEMDQLSKRYAKTKFYICDSLTNHIATPLSKALLLRGAKYRWDCYMRITRACLDEKEVRLWAQGGMERVRIGVESGSLPVLKLMNKDILPEQITTGLTNFANNGIQTSTLWIAGFPGEQEKDFQESLEFLRRNHKFIFQADILEYTYSDGGRSASQETGKAPLQRPLYSEEFDDMLIIKHYDAPQGIPSAERFERISQFERLRMELGILNPYSLNEWIAAQTRWAKLGHKKKI